jgi:hypothetical protein
MTKLRIAQTPYIGHQIVLNTLDRT